MIFGANRPEKRKYIPGYGRRYEIGDLGRVFTHGMEMSLIGGRYVKLCRNGVVDRVDVGYLVARAFLPNMEARPYVVRKDGNMCNNRVENLEWSEVKQKRGGGRPAVKSRPVAQYTADGSCVGRFESIVDAERKTGVSGSLIRRCADRISRQAKGFIWRYE